MAGPATHLSRGHSRWMKAMGPSRMMCRRSEYGMFDALDKIGGDIHTNILPMSWF